VLHGWRESTIDIDVKFAPDRHVAEALDGGARDSS
jgi:hypothetical protein